MPRILGAAVILALAAWIYGIIQRRAAMGGRSRVALAAVAIGPAAIAIVGGAIWPPIRRLAAESSGTGQAGRRGPYTPERLAALQAEGRPVLVNYTAAWCVSCQVNDRGGAVDDVGVRGPEAQQRPVYLKADWTKRDTPSPRNWPGSAGRAYRSTSCMARGGANRLSCRRS